MAGESKGKEEETGIGCVDGMKIVYLDDCGLV